MNAPRSQRGSALVVAMAVMGLLLVSGFAALSTIDTQQRESLRERTRESSFALAEGVLGTQIFLLSRQWPGTQALQYAGTCSRLTAADAKCPDDSTLRKTFQGVDYNAGLDWRSEIRDNGGTVANYYDDNLVRVQPQWDANADNHLWVRAQSVIRGRRRTLVALVRVESLTAQFPRNALVAGKLTIGPNGNQTYLSTGNPPDPIILRCTDTTLNRPACKGWSRTNHVGPNGQIIHNATQPPGAAAEVVERLRETARASGTYYATGCLPTLTGAVVFIEVANCSSSYNAPGNTAWNSRTSPGILVIGSGRIAFSGNSQYFGLIYNVNGTYGGTVRSDFVVELQGNSCIVGSVIVDGAGGVLLGSSNGANRCNGNLELDVNATNRLAVFGTAGIVANSFREIVPRY